MAMIKELVDRFEKKNPILRDRFSERHPRSYYDLVKTIITTLFDEEHIDLPDPERIHEIDDGEYQGCLVYVIAQQGYQPSNYWVVKVGYGSCSGCDTLEGIRSDYYGDKPNKQQVKDYMRLALNIVQGMKKI